MSAPIAVFWFRRDLRLDDNRGLYESLQSGLEVLPIFIFDTEILENLPVDDARVGFIYNTLQNIQHALKSKNKAIAIYHGKPLEVFEKIVDNFPVAKVFTNHDYEPYAQKRDKKIASFLNDKKIEFLTFKDQVIFEKSEVVKSDSTPYVVYTPYMKAWKANLKTADYTSYSSEKYLHRFVNGQGFEKLQLQQIGFRNSSVHLPDYCVEEDLLRKYEERRNLPAVNGTSMLGMHLRFGTVSIRKMVQKALKIENQTFLNELIWREFFMQILWHFPHTVHQAFKPAYDRIVWRNNETEFEKWKKGETGYPMVDAGMRQLAQTGWMHNRVRMLVGSFLCKHLLIDWRWGEAWFAEKLIDYEMSSNVGNWQWVAGCGVDAAPYFRIFNPESQLKKFDPQAHYVKRWVPEFEELNYVLRMVEHGFARNRCLETYKKALENH